LNFFRRIRVWLQKPWFVGALSVIAILYSGRNIVLPLMEISADNEKPVAGGGQVAPAVIAQNSTLTPLVGDEASHVGDVASLRLRSFSGGNYERNPFLFADDPRQPGYQEPVKPPVKQYIGNASISDAVTDGKAIRPQRLFSLNAILVRDGQKYALINRQVSAEGDAIVATEASINADELSGVQRQQLQELLALNYTLTQIGESEVEISGPVGSFSLSLR